LLSAAAYAAVLAWSCVLAPNFAPVTLFLGGVGGLMLLLVLARGLDDLLGSALLLVSACYVSGLFVGRHPLDEAAPLVGAALLLCSELATWSLEERRPIATSRALRLVRARAVGLLVLAGLAAAALVLVTATSSLGGGLMWAVLGAAAALAVVAVAARLSVSSSR
jgi:hypothetical protein